VPRDNFIAWGTSPTTLTDHTLSFDDPNVTSKAGSVLRDIPGSSWVVQYVDISEDVSSGQLTITNLTQNPPNPGTTERVDVNF
jgi:hypothetical protein